MFFTFAFTEIPSSIKKSVFKLELNEFLSHLPDKSIDVVLCGLALGHLPTIKASIHEIGRILKPEGVALVSDFHPYQYLTGARRIFEANKMNYAVEHYVHHLSDYFSLGQLANLQISALQEPIYQDNKPVVLVIRYEKDAD